LHFLKSTGPNPIRLALCTGVAAVLAGVAGIFFSNDLSWIRFYDNLHWTVATAAAAYIVWFSYRQSPGADSGMLFWAMLGMASYALGQVLWDIQAAAGHTAFPAPSDLPYLALGPCITIGLLKELKPRTTSPEFRSALLDSLLLMVGLVILMLVLYLPKRGNIELTPLLVLIAYPALLSAAASTAFITVVTLRSRISASLVLFMTGLVATALIWMHWNFMVLDGVATDGSYLNIIFSIGILLLGVGISQWKVERSDNLFFDRLCAGILRFLPMIAIVSATLSVVISSKLPGLPTPMENITDFGAVIVIVLAMIRQGSLLKERDQLIAARKDLEESKRQLDYERGFLQSLVGNIPDLIWLKNPEGVYLQCNPVAERLFGVKEAEILGKTDYDFFDRDLADFFRKHDDIAVKAMKPSVNEEWLTFADGSYSGLFETIKTPMYGSKGQLIGVLGIARDITERKRAEIEQRIAAAAFESQDGMLVTDANNVILRVNQAFTNITGYSAEEAVGQTPSLYSSGRQGREFYEAMWDAINNQGSWEGEIWNRRKNGEIFPDHLTITAVKDVSGKVINYVATHSDITERKAASEEIRNLAFYDPLTHLPNRRLLMDRLSQALATSARNGRIGALLFLDLDHFKTLNDTLGHDMGDLLLTQVAARLAECIREDDTLARLGGDEFVILVEDLSEQEIEAATQVEVMGEKILSALNQPYTLDSHEYRSTPSIGATLLKGHVSSVDMLLKQADIAMYQAKSSGRNALRFYDPKMQEAISARVDIERELRIAIKQQQFQLYYQMQVDDSGRPFGAEALIRWVHPGRGVIGPFDFIPLAEETGLILAIGKWVLDTACAQLAAWKKDAHTSRLMLSINVSPKQFHQADFAAQVKATVLHHDIDPSLLKLEITESMLLHDIDSIIITMNLLKEIGIRFELDDFGTGYSSLQYLKRLPISQLKIDQSFIRDITVDSSDRALVSTIITMAHSLDLGVIAEGVETEAQKLLLQNKGCHHYQGTLFSKPVPVAAFNALLEQWA